MNRTHKDEQQFPNYAVELQNAKDKRVVMFEALDPRKVQSADDAVALVAYATAISDRADLIKYRTIHDVHERGLWKGTKTRKGENCDKFVTWAEEVFGMKSAQAFNAVKIGALIEPDGTKTIFSGVDDDGNPRDFMGTHLLKIATSKKVFDKDGNFIEYPVLRHRTDEHGNWLSIVRREAGGSKHYFLYDVTDEKTDLVHALIACDEISLKTSVKDLTTALGKDWKFDDTGAFAVPADKAADKAADKEEDSESIETEDSEPIETVDEMQALRTMAEGVIAALKADNTEDFVKRAFALAKAVLKVTE